MSFKTVRGSITIEHIVEKSRFIVQLSNCRTEEEAQQFIASIKKKHYNASHNVPIYRLGDVGQVQKYSDDGEPAGTAGLPVLEMLKKENISDIVIVITRYFGGTKLGTGGLVRAYTQAVKLAITQIEVINLESYIKGLIHVAYHWLPTIQHTLEKSSVEVIETIYSDSVQLTVAITDCQWSKTSTVVQEKTNGEIHCQKLSFIYGAVINNQFIEYGEQEKT